MEKLKAKHDHKLTDILKVAIFGIFLILPFITWVPNAFYYGFNEHAVVGQEETWYNFYQGVKNGKPNSLEFWQNNSSDYGAYTSMSFSNEKLKIHITDFDELSFNIETETNFNLTNEGVVYLKLSYISTANVDIDMHFYDSELEFFDDNFTLTANGDETFTYYAEGTPNLYVDKIYLESPTQLQGVDIYFYNFQIFNLTEIFGSGSEPTKEIFESYLTQDYYNYGNNYVLKERGTNITWSMFNSWEDVWQTPMYNWTNKSILKQGLDNFTGTFGVSDTSYFTNIIVYELIMVAIYIVIDIVLTLFKWLTHLIGEK